MSEDAKGPSKAAEALVDRMESAISWAAQEWDMSNAEAVGCLELVKAALIARCLSSEDEDRP